MSQPATMRVVTVVLAAGEGRRIGGPKAFLPIGDATFLARAIEVSRGAGVASVLAVVGCGAERLAREARPPAGATVVLNDRYRDGMLSSVLCGLDAAEQQGADAILLHPVDHPLVTPETVSRVRTALEAGAVIAVPGHRGRRGHPGGFSKAAWDALRQVSPTRGARGVLADHPEWVVEVPGEAGCVCGVDTPADYERLIGSFPSVHATAPAGAEGEPECF
jgi:CTP:molybdopterin cytidylyltransferase MocA